MMNARISKQRTQSNFKQASRGYLLWVTLKFTTFNQILIAKIKLTNLINGK